MMVNEWGFSENEVSTYLRAQPPFYSRLKLSGIRGAAFGAMDPRSSIDTEHKFNSGSRLPLELAHAMAT